MFLAITGLDTMGRHKEWRKTAKRERRRKHRINAAKDREKVPSPSSSDYTFWLKEQESLHALELDQIECENKLENEKWQRAVEAALARWNVLQDKLSRDQQERIQKEARVRQEYEEEQKKRKEAEEKLKEQEEERKRQQDKFFNKLEQFLSGDSSDPPEELLITRESRPGTEICPFFNKTACCRFGDQCSRNHIYPGISNTLLAVNFFSHFGLENSNNNEYDTDLMLEYEDSDTYKVFKDFFYDVLPEFEKFGKVVYFKVCHNAERHLRGNTYVQFERARAAAAAFRALHARWYGGRQLALAFANVPSWKNAICGLQTNRRCPKGRACNFLHVFRNPGNLFNSFRHEQSSRKRSPHRSWRWSESPERAVSRGSSSRSHRSDRDRPDRSDRDRPDRSDRDRPDRPDRSDRDRPDRSDRDRPDRSDRDRPDRPDRSDRSDRSERPERRRRRSGSSSRRRRAKRED